MGLAGVGWSRGIEALEDGKPDLNKGSYYANPLHDSVTSDEKLLSLYPSYTTYGFIPKKTSPSSCLSSSLVSVICTCIVGLRLLV